MTNLYALIVGIEKYDLPGWNRSGPVAGAIEMAYWCNRIGMPYKNIHMFLSINDQDAAWVKERKDQLGHFKKSGAKIVEDSKLDAIDTFWREKLPKIANGDSKLLVYWCGHGVTRSDRDRILLHTDYNPHQLSGRVTSFNNFRATLATHAYHKFQEQLIVADVCGDFREQVSPNALPPANPVASIAQHCYFATVDGQPTQIQKGMGQFTQSTLEVLSEYHAWPSLDELKKRMDATFRNGSLNPFKISIRTPREDYDDSDDDSAKANDASLQSSSEDVGQLISTCNEHIKRNELDDLFQQLEDYLRTSKSTAFDEARNSLQILQSDFTSFRTGEINGTLMPDTDTQRRILITKIQKLLKLIESKDAKQTKKGSDTKPTVQSPHAFFSDQVRKLLNGSNEISMAFFSLLRSGDQELETDIVVDHMMGLDDTNATEYSLLRLRRLMKRLSDKKQVFDDSCRTVFTSIMDILSVASFPDEDRNRTEAAMQEVLRSDPEIGSTVQLSTALPKDVERLLMLTRLKLTSKKFEDFEIVQILNHDYREGEVHSPFFEFVTPVIIQEPTFPPDRTSTTSHYASCILESLGISQPPTDFEASLNHELRERKGLEGDGEVIALLLSDEASKNAQILRDAFPLLLVIVLQRESVNRYSTILQDRHAIEQILKRILRSPQK
jgi:hypothetical protein